MLPSSMHAPLSEICMELMPKGKNQKLLQASMFEILAVNKEYG